MKLSVHAVPHQSFLAIGSEVPIDKKSSFPPGEDKGGHCEFARDFIKRWVPTAKPLSQAPWACQLPFQGRFSRCPLWGKCRAAAKGVSLVSLSCFHSTSHTPSVSLAGSEVPSSLPAPPSGSQVGLVRIRPGFHKNAGAHRTPQPLRRQLPFQGRFLKGDQPHEKGICDFSAGRLPAAGGV